MACPGNPCGRNFCNEHKHCEGHQFRNEKVSDSKSRSDKPRLKF